MASVAVIGAGLAGNAAAIQLAGLGHEVHVFEKEKEICHKVCGEFLSGECSQYLAELDLDIDQLGATSIGHFKLYNQNQNIAADLPFCGRGISRQKLDQRLFEIAQQAGVQFHFLSRVSKISSRSLEVAGELLPFNAVFLATGKYDLKSFASRVGDENSSIGFKRHFRLPKGLYESFNEQIELHVYPGGYAGLSQIEDGLMNFACIIDQKRYRRIKSWDGLIKYQMADNLRLHKVFTSAEWLWPKPLSVSGIPYGFLSRPNTTSEGIFPIGDQVAVIPSLTGDGMGIALMSAKLAVREFQKSQVGELDLEQSSRNYITKMNEKLSQSMRIGGHLHRVFRKPLLAKILMAGLQPFPGVVNQLIKKTRGEYVSQA